MQAVGANSRCHSFLGHVLEPALPEPHLQDASAHWEAEATKYEHEASPQLPGSVKIAVLRRRASGALQQRLRLSASRLQLFC